MTITPETTVGEIAVTLSAAPGIFTGLGIDYCCGGRRTLAEACQRAGQSLDKVIQALTAAPQSEAPKPVTTDWRQEPLARLIGHILDHHHVFTRQELARLAPLLKKVSTVHANAHPELARLSELFQALTEELTSHLLKEEQVLFPYIIRMEEAIEAGLSVQPPFFRTVQNPVRMMSREHDLAGELLQAMRQLTNGYEVPADGCFSYQALYQGLRALEADLHQHIHLENNLLFPRATALEAAAEPQWQQSGRDDTTHHCFSP